ncbi:hypothetical protein GpartN1_g3909.t1 [Galdieria partita]|uniref:Histone H1 n=1 Tax=Galdieria partita TaxID=83374 RepID=A0A9C7PWI9_9RHOD|nr:hypothetical protein GpartN1_g3909.t1 [Galdieria partita]
MDKIEELKSLINTVEEDCDKFFEKGNKAAGVRARKTLQEIKKLAQELRVEIQASKQTEK